MSPTMHNLSYLVVALALAAPSPAAAGPVELKVASGKPLMQADRLGKNYLKVGLTGARPEGAQRVPVNLALVLDRSGSMAGAKMQEAKAAARLAVDRLSADDIISIVTYDSGVEVVVPATKAHDKRALYAAIARIQPRGNTALFAGVATGIAEVRKFLDKQRVNRVILLSDGQANVGPSSPNELARLGAAAQKEGVSVTTIGLGLGYNEDLMARLAKASDGNHAFAEGATSLAQIFQYELGDVMSVVAQEVTVKVRLPEGVRPVQLLNRDGEIHGRQVVVGFNQLYGGQEKFFLLEVELTAGRAKTSRPLATVDVSYARMTDGSTMRDQAVATVGFSSSQSEVAKAEDRAVMVAAVEALAVRTNREAVALRDKGQVQAAKQKLFDNAAFLKKNATRYRSKRLDSYGSSNAADADNLDQRSWNRRRKSMRKTQHELEMQQSY